MLSDTLTSVGPDSVHNGFERQREISAQHHLTTRETRMSVRSWLRGEPANLRYSDRVAIAVTESVLSLLQPTVGRVGMD